MRELALLIFLLALLWVGISGVYKPVVLVLGAASVVLVAWLAVRMKMVDREHSSLVLSWRLPLYWVWVMKEIIQANIHVARLTFSPKKVKPRIVVTDAPFKTSVGKVVYGNTCTLTPGTVTLVLTKDKLVAHALDTESAASLVSGELADKVRWLEGSARSEP